MGHADGKAEVGGSVHTGVTGPLSLNDSQQVDLFIKELVPIHTEPAAAGIPVSQHFPFHLNSPRFFSLLFKKSPPHGGQLLPVEVTEVMAAREEMGTGGLPSQHFLCTHNSYCSPTHTT